VKYIPSWFPGANFQRQAKEWQQACDNPKDLPFAHVEAKIVWLLSRLGDRTLITLKQEEGTARPCVLTSMLDRCKEDVRKGGKMIKDTPEDMAKGCATVAYLGGADTVSAVTHSNG
jgi:hypothetical protein